MVPWVPDNYSLTHCLMTVVAVDREQLIMLEFHRVATVIAYVLCTAASEFTRIGEVLSFPLFL